MTTLVNKSTFKSTFSSLCTMFWRLPIRPNQNYHNKVKWSNKWITDARAD